jgi:hypothetical protein
MVRVRCWDFLGALFTPSRSARAMLGVLDRLTPADSGRLFAWDG